MKNSTIALSFKLTVLIFLILQKFFYTDVCPLLRCSLEALCPLYNRLVTASCAYLKESTKGIPSISNSEYEFILIMSKN